jgi:pimeloyl-ACP methyl ester carboxylesterase
MASLVLIAATLAAASPATAQAPVALVRTTSIALADDTLRLDVYSPAAGAPIGLAIVAHGWTRSRDNHRDLGRALADAGIVAIVPDLPNVLDLWGNGSLVVELVGRLEGGALELPPATRSSIVLLGTSAGGLATLYAASKLPGLAGWIGLDPVDRTGTGIYAASKLDAPAVVLLGDASACNLFGSGRDIARSVPRLVRQVRIAGASHCDFESPTSKFCTALCGRASRDKQDEAIRETVLASQELLGLSQPGRTSPAPPTDDGDAARPPPEAAPGDVPEPPQDPRDR